MKNDPGALVFPVLDADQIEVKIKSVSQKGAVALLYKTARTDMDMLDAIVGPMNWRVEYTEIKGNLYCTLFIRDQKTNEWVGKQDCGTESRADGEGNEKKGEASDAFKRAGFRWGIGRELYTAPFTFLNVETKKDGSRYVLAKPFERFSISAIAYGEDRHITWLSIVDSKGRTVYSTDGKTAAPGGDDDTATGDDAPLGNQPAAQAAAAEVMKIRRYKNAWNELAAVYGIEKTALTSMREELIEHGKLERKDLAAYTDAQFKKMLEMLEDELLALGYSPVIEAAQ